MRKLVPSLPSINGKAIKVKIGKSKANIPKFRSDFASSSCSFPLCMSIHALCIYSFHFYDQFLHRRWIDEFWARSVDVECRVECYAMSEDRLTHFRAFRQGLDYLFLHYYLSLSSFRKLVLVYVFCSTSTLQFTNTIRRSLERNLSF